MRIKHKIYDCGRFVFLALCMILFQANEIYGQEFNAHVQVVTQRKIASQINAETISDLKNNIQSFINDTQWTTEPFPSHAKININILITINAHDAETNGYETSMQIQYSRPIFNSDYYSNVFMIDDKAFNFYYVEGLPIENNFNVYRYENELGLSLSFYMYLVLGMDFDSFTLFGGTQYYSEAQRIVQICQNSNNQAAWRSDKTNDEDNRYWISENFNNRSLIYLRTFIYNYHRNGLDLFYENQSGTRRSILSYLEKLREIDKIRPNLFLKRLLLLAKSDEMVDIFSNAEADEKKRAYELCSSLDPINSNKYKKILKKKQE